MSEEVAQKPCIRCGAADRDAQKRCRPCAGAATKRWKATRGSAYLEAERQRERIRSRARHLANPSLVRNRTLRYKYNLSPTDYAALYAVQRGTCAICFQPETAKHKNSVTKALSVDHDHVTGRVRQLLCDACNQGIGKFRDNPALLRAAADYLEHHHAETRTK